MFACRESGVIEDDSISGEFDNFPEGKVRLVKIPEEIRTKSRLVEFSVTEVPAEWELVLTEP